jgi:hypothetical protein
LEKHQVLDEATNAVLKLTLLLNVVKIKDENEIKIYPNSVADCCGWL